MSPLIPRSKAQSLRVFWACLLAFNILITPIAAVASTYKRLEVRDQRLEKGTSPTGTETAKSAVAEVFAKPLEDLVRTDSAKTDLAKSTVPEAVPAPAPLPAAPPVGSVTSSLTASLLAANGGVDADADGKADPGDTIAYTLSLANTSGAGATGLAIANPLDPHTTLVNGSLNSTPVAFDQSVSLNEDATLVITLQGQDPDGSNLTFKKSDGTAFPSNPTTIATAHGTIGNFGSVTCDANGVCSQQVTYTPAADYNGPDSFTFKANDGTANSNEVGTVSITVNSVDDAPTFTAGTNQTVNEDAGVTIVSNFLTNVRPAQSGNTTEDGQSVIVEIVSNDNTGLFSAGPSFVLSGASYPKTFTLNYTPALDQHGVATIKYHVKDDACPGSPGTPCPNGGVDTSSPDQTFTITINAVNDVPTAAPKSYNAQANMKITIPAASGLLVGAADAKDVAGNASWAPTFKVGTVNGVAPASGVITTTVAGVGTFIVNETTGALTVDPAPGVTGTVSTNYTVCDNGEGLPAIQCSATQTLSLVIAGPVIWFVDPARAVNGNGVLSDDTAVAGGPGAFNSLASAATAMGINSTQRIFVYSGSTPVGQTVTLAGSTTGTLPQARVAAQWLVGQGTVASGFDSFFGISPPSGTIARPTLSNTPTTANGMRPTIRGTVTMKENSQVQGLNIDTSAGGTGGLKASGLAQGTSGSLLTIKDVNVKTAAGNAVDIAGSSNTNNSVEYTTSDQTNSPNILISGSGTALKVDTVLLGANGLTFQSITATAATNGIFLNNAGANGFLNVYGDGSNTAQGGNNSGGTISTTGSDNTTSGIGVYLNSVKNITLRRMHLLNNSNYGIFGNSVTAFKFEYSKIDGTNGSNILTDGEDSIQINGLFGTGATDNSIKSDIIKGGWRDNVHIHNITATNASLGTPDKLTITGCLISDTNTGSNGNDNVHVRTDGSGNIKVDVTNNSFAATNGDHFQTIADEQSKLQVVFTGNLLFGGGGGSALGQGITISGGTATPVDSTEVVRFNISNNGTAGTPITGTIQGGAININEGSGSGDWQGQVSNNFIGLAGSHCSGATQSSGIRLENHSKGTLTGILSGNTIKETCGAGGGISLSAGDNTASGLGNGALNATVSNNTISVPAATPYNFDHGVVLTGGAGVAGNTNIVCLDMSNNSSAGSPVVGSSGFAYRIRERFSQTVRLPGYTGANNDNAAVATYFANRPNTAIAGNGGTYSITNTVGSGGNGFTNTSPAGSQCSQPTVPLVGFNLAPQPGSGQFVATILGDSYDKPGESLLSSLTTTSTYDSILESLNRVTFAAPDASTQVAESRAGSANVPTDIVTLTANARVGAVQPPASRSANLAGSASSLVNAIAQAIEPTAHAEAKTGAGSRESAVRGQRSEVRGQSSAVRMNHAVMAAIRGEAEGVRSQESGVRSQTLEVRGQRLDVRLNHARANSKLKTENSKLAAPAAAPPTPVGSFPINGTGAGAGFQLPNNKTITITFKATLNAPPNLSGPVNPKVTAQATLTGSFVGNPLVSDDPAVGGTTDPTSTNVDLYDSTTALSASPSNSTNTGQAVTFTATIGTAGTPSGSATNRTGTVNFKDNGSSIGCDAQTVSHVGSSDVATCTTSSLTTGSHANITAAYSGDGNFDPSTSSAFTQTVAKSGTNATLTSSLNPSTVTQTVTFTATITTATSVPNPTGSVVFKDGGGAITCTGGTQTLNGSGVATCQISNLAAGNHAITADYGGDTNFNANNGIVLTGGSPAGNQTVNKATPTVTLVSPANPAFVSQNVTFTATVAAPGGITATPSGSLTFKDGGVAMTCTGGNQTLSAGVATCQKNNLTAGSHTITVDYPTDANFNAVSGTGMTAAAGQNGNPQVVSQSNTTMTVSSSLNPSKVSESVKFTVNIISSNLGAVPGPPTGQVKFWDGPVGGTQIGVTKTLGSGGTCNANSACVDSDATTTLTAGTHTITVEYLGDSNFSTNAQTLSGGQVVNKSDTTTTITSNTPNPSNVAQQVDITAHVTSSGVTFTNTGTVLFKEGANTIAGCSAQTINGSGDALCSTTALPAGTLSLTAVYSGDATFNTSTSASVPQQVGPTCSNPATVTNTSDGGAGSLRQALVDVCDGGTINFDTAGTFATPQTITIASLLSITKNVTITGPGSANVSINGAGATQIFTMVGGKTASVTGITLNNGNVVGAAGGPGAAGSSAMGGCLNNAGTMTLTDVNVNNCQAIGGVGGAGVGVAGGNGGNGLGGNIFNSGTLTLNNSSITNGKATGGAGGDSDTANGSGGQGFGGGIYNVGTLTVNNSTVSSNNAATGGAAGSGTGTAGAAGPGSGGGIYNDGFSVATVFNISGSTISGNTASTTGGGIANIGTGTNAAMSITNSTISGNSANGNGGGIYNDSATAAVTLTSVTITGNHADSDTNGSGGGGGISSLSNNIALWNSIVAGNFNGTGNGVKQVETVTVSGTAVTNSSILVRVTAAGMPNSPKDVSVTVNNGDTAAVVASSIQTALTNDTDVGGFFDVTTATADVILTRKVAAANDATMHVKIFGNVTGISNADSVHTTAGVAPTSGVQQVETATVVGTITVGVNQVETATVTTNAGANGAMTTGGSFNVTVTAAGMNNTPKVVGVTVADNDDQDAVATKIRAALIGDADVGDVTTGFFTVSGSGADVVLTAKTTAANDTSMNIAIGACALCVALDPHATSADTTAGVAPGSGNAIVTVTAAGMNNSPKTLNVPVLAGDDAAAVAGKMRAALSGDADVTNAITGFTVSGATDKIVLTKNTAAANDATLNIATDNGTCTGLTAQPTSADTTSGVGGTAGTAQVETVTVSGAPVTSNGSIQVVVTAAGMTGSPRTVIVSLTTAQTTNDLVADQIELALQADTNVSSFFSITSPGANVVLTRNAAAADDSTMHISIVGASGINSADSVHTVPGTSPETPNDISGTLKTTGSASSYNLIGNAGSSGGLTNGTDFNRVGNAGTGTIDIATVLDTALADNSGPTKTHKLVDNSPAIDKGNKLGLTTDQRGFQRPVDLDDGTYPNVSDASDIGAFERQTPPAQPTITLTSVNTALTTRDSTPDFSIGNLTVGATVELLRGGVSTSPATTVVASASTMALTDNTLITDGVYSYSAKQTIGGDTATSPAIVVTVDTRPTVTALFAADDTGASSSDKITKITTPRFTGTADINTSLLIFASNGGPAVQVGSGTSDGSGNWNITSSVLADGTYSITAKEVIGGFTGAASAPLTGVVIDTLVSPPSTPVLLPADDSGAADNITNKTTPTFTGTAEANSAIQLFANGNPVGAGSANGAGNWSVASSALSDGTYLMTAVATDLAGNVSSSSGGLTVTIDTQVTAPSMPDLISGDDTGAFNNDNVTKKNTPTFTGTAEADSTVKLFADNGGGAVQVGTGTATGGNWSIASSALADGTYQITATATDTAGNVSVASTGLSVTIDTQVPAKPSAPDLTAADDTGILNTDNITKATTPTFTGTSEANATIDLFKNSGGGPTLTGTGSADGSGNWNAVSLPLADGTYQMTVVATDLAGNQSVSSDPLSVTIDTTPPAAPSTPVLNPADDTGTSNSDGITKKNTPNFTGTAEANSIVQLFAGASPVGSGTAAGGGWSITSGLLPDNSYNMTAQATDLAGNTGVASGALPITVDTVKPTVTMSSVVGNPTATTPIPVTVVFSEPVTGFTLSDIVATNGTTGNFAGSNANYSFDLTPTAAGGVSADIAADGATDTAGNGNTAAVQFNRTFDPSALNATITPISPNPRNTAVSSITIVFNKPVTGFDLADLTLKLNGGANLLTGAQTLNSADNATWTLGNLAGITAAQGTYDLKLTAAGSNIQDSGSTALASDATASWVTDTAAPTVTVEQAVGQTDPFTGPSGTSIINFTATFSESVTGLTASGVTLSGTANATIVNVSGSGTTYNLAVQGMTGSGTVIATVNASAAQDSAGNGNAASTSVDNTVQFNADNFTTIEVNTTADTDDGSCDPLGTGSGNQDCTLREAINAANADFGADTITFNIPNTDPGFSGGVYTIGLLSALPDITTDMTIQGPGAKVLMVKRNAAANFRIFFVHGNATVSISGLTVTNGNLSGGGGLRVGTNSLDQGTLTLTNATVTGNTSTGPTPGGGGIDLEAGALTIIGSTISNNNALDTGSSSGGGGIANNGGTLTLINSTVSGNAATGPFAGNMGGGINNFGTATLINSTVTNNTGASGGGVWIQSGTVTVRSTIIAGNTGTSSNPDVSNNGATFNSEGFSLIGNTAGASMSETLNPGTNILNQSAQLNPLADNGGPTMTHSLLCTSPAIDKGFKFTTTTDQRGSTRPFDFADAVYPNAAAPGDGSDIGAFETQSAGGCVPLAIAPSPAPSTNEDNAVTMTLKGTYSQNTNLSFAITQNPAIGQLSAISAPVCNYDSLNLLMTCTADVTYTPNPNANGADLFKFKVSAGGLDSDPADVNVTINATNDPPTFLQAGNQTVNEDAGPQSVANFITVFSPGPPDESGQTVQFVVTGNTNPGLFSAAPAIDGTGTLTYTPAANANGSATITIVAQDNGGGTNTSAPQSFTITVLSVNDAPSFTVGPDQTVLEDAGQQIVNNFMTGISVGPAQESAQTAQFVITNNTNPNMFAEGPVISPAGKLTYVSAPDANGTATITVVLKDNGGTANAGQDTSAPQTFVINVTPVNDQPTLNPITNVTIDEDAATQTINLSGISAGGAETQVLGITATSNNPSLIPSPLALSYTSPNAGGSITFKPLADQNGFATITVTLKDDGGTANGGVDTVVRTFVIQVNPVNDAPINNVPGPQTTIENRSLVFALSNGNPISISDVDASGSQVKVTLTATNGVLALPHPGTVAFLVGNGIADQTMTFVGSVTNINAALQGLIFTPTNGFSGAASLQITTNDQGDTGSGGPLTDTDTVSITVDDGGALQFSASTYSVTENNGPAVITITRTGGSAGLASVQIDTSNGTATAGSDYTAVSQTVTFGIGETSKTVTIPITDDFFNEPDETVNLTLSNAGGSGALGSTTTAVLTINNDDPTGGYLKFSAPTYSAAEGGFVTITVQRVGTLTDPVSVDFATNDNSDPPTLIPCLPTPGNTLASSRCDFDSAFGRLTWAAGDGADKTFTVFTTQDNYTEGPETLTLTLSNLTASAAFSGASTATLTINDDAAEPAVNPIDDSDTFVEEMYRDFLNRTADGSGKAFWVNVINHCNDPAQRPAGQTAAQCIQIARVVTAGAFFLSIEFQGTGGTAYLTNKASFGSLPTFARFERDALEIGRNYVVGQPGADAILEANKVAYFNGYVARTEFMNTYNGLSNQQYVDTLISNTGVSFTLAERNQLLNGLNNQTETRATVLRKITEKDAFRTAEINRMFVLMEYFGFLRRNPDQAGFDFWLNKLNSFNGDYFAAEMVKAFIESNEYRQRFGQ